MSDSFCPTAWNSIYLEPTGNVDNCCIAKNYIGNINNTTDITDIVVGPKNVAIQELMLAGKEVAGCKSCHGKAHSFQDGMVERFKKEIERGDYSTTGTFKLEYLDARWSNTCNLACVYCSPSLSSLWAQQEKQYHRIEPDSKSNALNYVLDNVKSLKYVYLAGGEPLLMKENKLLIAAIAEQNPNCHILVNSNISDVNDNEIFENLIKLKNCEWLISVDSIGREYEYLRWPANWDTFHANLLTIKSKVGVRKIGFNMVVTNMNGVTIWDAVDLLLESEFQANRIGLVLYNNGAYNGAWDIRHMPVEYQKQVLARMDRSEYKNLIGWQNVFDYINELVYNKQEQPWQMLDKLDQQRGLDSRSVFPEIYKYKD